MKLEGTLGLVCFDLWQDKAKTNGLFMRLVAYLRLVEELSFPIPRGLRTILSTLDRSNGLLDRPITVGIAS